MNQILLLLFSLHKILPKFFLQIQILKMRLLSFTKIVPRYWLFTIPIFLAFVNHEGKYDKLIVL